MFTAENSPVRPYWSTASSPDDRSCDVYEDFQRRKRSGVHAFPPCAHPKPLNSRRRVRAGLTGRPSGEGSPQFVQPPATYYRGRHSGILSYGGIRQKQIQVQSSKLDLSKHGSRRDKPKPYVLEAPPSTQRFPNSGNCDFYPWSGAHPEDHVTDTQARNGYYDKLFVGKHNNEQASSRALLGPTIRQNMTLHTLSSLYLAVLTGRELHSSIISLSTFKPPPRVTLPDQRREAWLNDLANPFISLRRLSRTIPHGLKGPALLEQCSSKNIPLARAVWFVRCVGANELRGLKRKGVGSLAVGGEVKWIREWTVQVIQFLERTLVPCDPTARHSWLKNVHYSLHLAGHLYAENLLDRTAFLDWLLPFLESHSLDLFGCVLALIPIFWGDIFACRRISGKLTRLVLSKYGEILHSAGGSYMQLLRRLSVIVSRIALCHRASLVQSDDSSRVSIDIASVDRRIAHFAPCVLNIVSRRCCLSHRHTGRQLTVSKRRQAIELLDTALVPFNVEELFRNLRTLLMEPWLVSCIFEWSVTSLRAGLYRVYLGATLLRYGFDEGMDIQTPLMEFMAQENSKMDRYNIYLLISELVRGQCFSLALYLRWLIAKGGVTKVNSFRKGCPTHVQLLVEIPTQFASPSLVNLQNILLRGISGCDVKNRSVEDIKNFLLIDHLFRGSSQPVRYMYAGLSRSKLEIVRRMPRAAKSELGLWIRGQSEVMLAQVAGLRQHTWRDDTETNSVLLNRLISIRQLLEEIDDFVILADVIKMAAVSADWAILDLVVDTAFCNLESFSALGCLDEIVQLCFARNKFLQTQGTVDKAFMSSFGQLLTASGRGAILSQDLDYNLTTYELQCSRPGSSFGQSPVSESLENVFSDVESESGDEIDRLCHTSAAFPRPELTRLFETTVSKVESAYEDTNCDSYIFSTSRALLKLRRLDVDGFDELMLRWVARMQYRSEQVPLFRTFTSYISYSCLKIEHLVDVALAMLRKCDVMTMTAHSAGMFMARVLDMILHHDPFETSLSAKENLYTLKRQRKAFVLKSGSVLLTLLRVAIELCATSEDRELKTHVSALISSGEPLKTIRMLALRQECKFKETVIDPLLQANNPIYTAWLQLLLDSLLADPDSNESMELDSDVRVARLMDLVDDFSVGLCKLKLQAILRADINAGAVNTCQPTNTIVRSFLRGIASSCDKQRLYTELLTTLDRNCAQKIRSDTEKLLLECDTFPPSRTLMELLDLPVVDDPESGQFLARAFMTVIISTAPSLATDEKLYSAVINRMARLFQTLGDDGPDKLTRSSMHELTIPDAREEFRCWFVLFMKLVLACRVGPNHTGQSVGHRAIILTGICCLLQIEFIHDSEPLFDFVLDVLCCFFDDLVDDTRTQQIEYARGKCTFPALAYSVGGSPSDSEHLNILCRGKPMEFVTKPWERLAEPTPNVGENDVSLGLTLFKARKL